MIQYSSGKEFVIIQHQSGTQLCEERIMRQEVGVCMISHVHNIKIMDDSGNDRGHHSHGSNPDVSSDFSSLSPITHEEPASPRTYCEGDDRFYSVDQSNETYDNVSMSLEVGLQASGTKGLTTSDYANSGRSIKSNNRSAPTLPVPSRPTGSSQRAARPMGAQRPHGDRSRQHSLEGGGAASDSAGRGAAAPVVPSSHPPSPAASLSRDGATHGAQPMWSTADFSRQLAASRSAAPAGARTAALRSRPTRAARVREEVARRRLGLAAAQPRRCESDGDAPSSDAVPTTRAAPAAPPAPTAARPPRAASAGRSERGAGTSGARADAVDDVWARPRAARSGSVQSDVSGTRGATASRYSDGGRRDSARSVRFDDVVSVSLVDTDTDGPFRRTPSAGGAARRSQSRRSPGAGWHPRAAPPVTFESLKAMGAMGPPHQRLPHGHPHAHVHSWTGGQPDGAGQAGPRWDRRPGGPAPAPRGHSLGAALSARPQRPTGGAALDASDDLSISCDVGASSGIVLAADTAGSSGGPARGGAPYGRYVDTAGAMRLVLPQHPGCGDATASGGAAGGAPVPWHVRAARAAEAEWCGAFAASAPSPSNSSDSSSPSANGRALLTAAARSQRGPNAAVQAVPAAGVPSLLGGHGAPLPHPAAHLHKSGSGCCEWDVCASATPRVGGMWWDDMFAQTPSATRPPEAQAPPRGGVVGTCPPPSSARIVGDVWLQTGDDGEDASPRHLFGRYASGADPCLTADCLLDARAAAALHSPASTASAALHSPSPPSRSRFEAGLWGDADITLVQSPSHAPDVSAANPRGGDGSPLATAAAQAVAWAALSPEALLGVTAIGALIPAADGASAATDPSTDMPSPLRGRARALDTSAAHIPAAHVAALRPDATNGRGQQAVPGGDSGTVVPAYGTPPLDGSADVEDDSCVVSCSGVSGGDRWASGTSRTAGALSATLGAASFVSSVTRTSAASHCGLLPSPSPLSPAPTSHPATTPRRRSSNARSRAAARRALAPSSPSSPSILPPPPPSHTPSSTPSSVPHSTPSDSFPSPPHTQPSTGAPRGRPFTGEAPQPRGGVPHELSFASTAGGAASSACATTPSRRTVGVSAHAAPTASYPSRAAHRRGRGTATPADSPPPLSTPTSAAVRRAAPLRRASPSATVGARPRSRSDPPRPTAPAPQHRRRSSSGGPVIGTATTSPARASGGAPPADTVALTPRRLLTALADALGAYVAATGPPGAAPVPGAAVVGEAAAAVAAAAVAVGDRGRDGARARTASGASSDSSASSGPGPRVAPTAATTGGRKRPPSCIVIPAALLADIDGPAHATIATHPTTFQATPRSSANAYVYNAVQAAAHHAVHPFDAHACPSLVDHAPTAPLPPTVLHAPSTLRHPPINMVPLADASTVSALTAAVAAFMPQAAGGYHPHPIHALAAPAAAPAAPAAGLMVNDSVIAQAAAAACAAASANGARSPTAHQLATSLIHFAASASHAASIGGSQASVGCTFGPSYSPPLCTRYSPPTLGAPTVTGSGAYHPHAYASGRAAISTQHHHASCFDTAAAPPLAGAVVPSLALHGASPSPSPRRASARLPAPGVPLYSHAAYGAPRAVFGAHGASAPGALRFVSADGATPTAGAVAAPQAMRAATGVSASLLDEAACAFIRACSLATASAPSERHSRSAPSARALLGRGYGGAVGSRLPPMGGADGEAAQPYAPEEPSLRLVGDPPAPAVPDYPPRPRPSVAAYGGAASSASPMAIPPGFHPWQGPHVPAAAAAPLPHPGHPLRANPPAYGVPTPLLPPQGAATVPPPPRRSVRSASSGRASSVASSSARDYPARRGRNPLLGLARSTSFSVSASPAGPLGGPTGPWGATSVVTPSPYAVGCGLAHAQPAVGGAGGGPVVPSTAASRAAAAAAAARLRRAMDTTPAPTEVSPAAVDADGGGSDDGACAVALTAASAATPAGAAMSASTPPAVHPSPPPRHAAAPVAPEGPPPVAGAASAGLSPRSPAAAAASPSVATAPRQPRPAAARGASVEHSPDPPSRSSSAAPGPRASRIRRRPLARRDATRRVASEASHTSSTPSSALDRGSAAREPPRLREGAVGAVERLPRPARSAAQPARGSACGAASDASAAHSAASFAPPPPPPPPAPRDASPTASSMAATAHTAAVSYVATPQPPSPPPRFTRAFPSAPPNALVSPTPPHLAYSADPSRPMGRPPTAAALSSPATTRTPSRAFDLGAPHSPAPPQPLHPNSAVPPTAPPHPSVGLWARPPDDRGADGAPRTAAASCLNASAASSRDALGCTVDSYNNTTVRSAFGSSMASGSSDDDGVVVRRQRRGAAQGGGAPGDSGSGCAGSALDAQPRRKGRRRSSRSDPLGTSERQRRAHGHAAGGESPAAAGLDRAARRAARHEARLEASLEDSSLHASRISRRGSDMASPSTPRRRRRRDSSRDIPLGGSARSLGSGGAACDPTGLVSPSVRGAGATIGASHPFAVDGMVTSSAAHPPRPRMDPFLRIQQHMAETRARRDAAVVANGGKGGATTDAAPQAPPRGFEEDIFGPAATPTVAASVSHAAGPLRSTWVAPTAPLAAASVTSAASTAHSAVAVPSRRRAAAAAADVPVTVAVPAARRGAAAAPTHTPVAASAVAPVATPVPAHHPAAMSPPTAGDVGGAGLNVTTASLHSRWGVPVSPTYGASEAASSIVSRLTNTEYLQSSAVAASGVSVAPPSGHRARGASHPAPTHPASARATVPATPDPVWFRGVGAHGDHDRTRDPDCDASYDVVRPSPTDAYGSVGRDVGLTGQPSACDDRENDAPARAAHDATLWGATPHVLPSDVAAHAHLMQHQFAHHAAPGSPKAALPSHPRPALHALPTNAAAVGPQGGVFPADPWSPAAAKDRIPEPPAGPPSPAPVADTHRHQYRQQHTSMVAYAAALWESASGDAAPNPYLVSPRVTGAAHSLASADMSASFTNVTAVTGVQMAASGAPPTAPSHAHPHASTAVAPSGPLGAPLPPLSVADVASSLLALGATRPPPSGGAGQSSAASDAGGDGRVLIMRSSATVPSTGAAAWGSRGSAVIALQGASAPAPVSRSGSMASVVSSQWAPVGASMAPLQASGDALPRASGGGWPAGTAAHAGSAVGSGYGVDSSAVWSAAADESGAVRIAVRQPVRGAAAGAHRASPVMRTASAATVEYGRLETSFSPSPVPVHGAHTAPADSYGPERPARSREAPRRSRSHRDGTGGAPRPARPMEADRLPPRGAADGGHDDHGGWTTADVPTSTARSAYVHPLRAHAAATYGVPLATLNAYGPVPIPAFAPRSPPLRSLRDDLHGNAVAEALGGGARHLPPTAGAHLAAIVSAEVAGAARRAHAAGGAWRPPPADALGDSLGRRPVPHRGAALRASARHGGGCPYGLDDGSGSASAWVSPRRPRRGLRWGDGRGGDTSGYTTDVSVRDARPPRGHRVPRHIRDHDALGVVAARGSAGHHTRDRPHRAPRRSGPAREPGHVIASVPDALARIRRHVEGGHTSSDDAYTRHRSAHTRAGTHAEGYDSLSDSSPMSSDAWDSTPSPALAQRAHLGNARTWRARTIGEERAEYATSTIPRGQGEGARGRGGDLGERGVAVPAEGVNRRVVSAVSAHRSSGVTSALSWCVDATDPDGIGIGHTVSQATRVALSKVPPDMRVRVLEEGITDRVLRRATKGRVAWPHRGNREPHDPRTHQRAHSAGPPQASLVTTSKAASRGRRVRSYSEPLSPRYAPLPPLVPLVMSSARSPVRRLPDVLLPTPLLHPQPIMAPRGPPPPPVAVPVAAPPLPLPLPSGPDVVPATIPVPAAIAFDIPLSPPAPMSAAAAAAALRSARGASVASAASSVLSASAASRTLGGILSQGRDGYAVDPHAATAQDTTTASRDARAARRPRSPRAAPPNSLADTQLLIPHHYGLGQPSPFAAMSGSPFSPIASGGPSVISSPSLSPSPSRGRSVRVRARPPTTPPHSFANRRSPASSHQTPARSPLSFYETPVASLSRSPYPRDRARSASAAVYAHHPSYSPVPRGIAVPATLGSAAAAAAAMAAEADAALFRMAAHADRHAPVAAPVLGAAPLGPCGLAGVATGSSRRRHSTGDTPILLGAGVAVASRPSVAPMRPGGISPPPLRPTPFMSPLGPLVPSVMPITPTPARHTLPFAAACSPAALSLSPIGPPACPPPLATCGPGCASFCGAPCGPLCACAGTAPSLIYSPHSFPPLSSHVIPPLPAPLRPRGTSRTSVASGRPSASPPFGSMRPHTLRPQRSLSAPAASVSPASGAPLRGPPGAAREPRSAPSPVLSIPASVSPLPRGASAPGRDALAVHDARIAGSWGMSSPTSPPRQAARRGTHASIPDTPPHRGPNAISPATVTADMRSPLSPMSPLSPLSGPLSAPVTPAHPRASGARGHSPLRSADTSPTGRPVSPIPDTGSVPVGALRARGRETEAAHGLHTRTTASVPHGSDLLARAIATAVSGTIVRPDVPLVSLHTQPSGASPLDTRVTATSVSVANSIGFADRDASLHDMEDSRTRSVSRHSANRAPPFVPLPPRSSAGGYVHGVSPSASPAIASPPARQWLDVSMGADAPGGPFAPQVATPQRGPERPSLSVGPRGAARSSSARAGPAAPPGTHTGPAAVWGPATARSHSPTSSRAAVAFSPTSSQSYLDVSISGSPLGSQGSPWGGKPRAVSAQPFPPLVVPPLTIGSLVVAAGPAGGPRNAPAHASTFEATGGARGRPLRPAVGPRSTSSPNTSAHERRAAAGPARPSSISPIGPAGPRPGAALGGPRPVDAIGGVGPFPSLRAHQSIPSVADSATDAALRGPTASRDLPAPPPLDWSRSRTMEASWVGGDHSLASPPLSPASAPLGGPRGRVDPLAATPTLLFTHRQTMGGASSSCGGDSVHIDDDTLAVPPPLSSAPAHPSRPATAAATPLPSPAARGAVSPGSSVGPRSAVPGVLNFLGHGGAATPTHTLGDALLSAAAVSPAGDARPTHRSDSADAAGVHSPLSVGGISAGVAAAAAAGWWRGGPSMPSSPVTTSSSTFPPSSAVSIEVPPPLPRDAAPALPSRGPHAGPALGGFAGHSPLGALHAAAIAAAAGPVSPRAAAARSRAGPARPTSRSPPPTVTVSPTHPPTAPTPRTTWATAASPAGLDVSAISPSPRPHAGPSTAALRPIGPPSMAPTSPLMSPSASGSSAGPARSAAGPPPFAPASGTTTPLASSSALPVGSDAPRSPSRLRSVQRDAPQPTQSAWLATVVPAPGAAGGDLRPAASKASARTGDDEDDMVRMAMSFGSLRVEHLAAAAVGALLDGTSTIAAGSRGTSAFAAGSRAASPDAVPGGASTSLAIGSTEGLMSAGSASSIIPPYRGIGTSPSRASAPPVSAGLGRLATAGRRTSGSAPRNARPPSPPMMATDPAVLTATDMTGAHPQGGRVPPPSVAASITTLRSRSPSVSPRAARSGPTRVVGPPSSPTARDATDGTRRAPSVPGALRYSTAPHDLLDGRLTAPSSRIGAVVGGDAGSLLRAGSASALRASSVETAAAHGAYGAASVTSDGAGASPTARLVRPRSVPSTRRSVSQSRVAVGSWTPPGRYSACASVVSGESRDAAAAGTATAAGSVDAASAGPSHASDGLFKDPQAAYHPHSAPPAPAAPHGMGTYIPPSASASFAQTGLSGMHSIFVPVHAVAPPPPPPPASDGVASLSRAPSLSHPTARPPIRRSVSIARSDTSDAAGAGTLGSNDGAPAPVVSALSRAFSRARSGGAASDDGASLTDEKPRGKATGAAPSAPAGPTRPPTDATGRPLFGVPPAPASLAERSQRLRSAVAAAVASGVVPPPPQAPEPEPVPPAPVAAPRVSALAAAVSGLAGARSSVTPTPTGAPAASTASLAGAPVAAVEASSPRPARPVSWRR